MESNPAGALAAGIDSVTREEWAALLHSFKDGSIYQTWDYVKTRSGASPVSTVVLSRGGEALSAALVRIRKAPLLPVRVAYIGFGPAWKKQSDCYDLTVVGGMLDCLAQEYVLRRNCYLRIFPAVYSHAEQAEAIRRLFLDRGFSWKPRPDRTLLLDLSPPAEALRANINKKWRYTLSQAEKAGLEIAAGMHESLYCEALEAYRQMHARKRFSEFVDNGLLGAIQAKLDNKDKLHILVARGNGAAAAALAWSLIGDTGHCLFAATTESGLDVGASYLLWWKMVCDMKAQGARYCDLCGISPEHNPGGYQFKSGLAGKKRIDTTYIGQFDLCRNRFAAALFPEMERLRFSVVRLKAALGR